MEAGRELDALVAEKVMGWEVVDHPDMRDVRVRFIETDTSHGLVTLDDGRTGTIRRIEGYSTDISAAWEVVEKLKESREWFPEVHDNAHQHWCAIWYKGPKNNQHGWVARQYGSSAAHAICLAALEAVGAEELGP